MEYTVDLGARMGAQDLEELTDQLLTALERIAAERQLAGPVTGLHVPSRTVSARFCVEAPDVLAAAAFGAALFRTALAACGESPELPLCQIEVEEYRDEFEEEAAYAQVSDGLVTGAEIGRQLRVSRERVRQWATGERYGFPVAVGKIGASSVWRWPEVEAWYEEYRKAPLKSGRPKKSEQ